MSLVKNKVLMAIPVLYKGGTEEQMITMISCLKDLYAISVLCYFEADPLMVKRLEELGVETIVLEMPKFSSKKTLIDTLHQHFKTLAPDFIHIQYIAPGLAPILAAKKAGIKNIFATVHQPGTPYGFKQKLMIKFAAFLSKKFICVSEAVKNSWFKSEKLLKNKILVITNAIDFSEMIKENDLPNQEPPYIMYAGRLRSEKGVDILLKSFALIADKIPHQLHIAGTGPDEEKLKQIADDSGFSTRIKWLGFLNKPDLYKKMANANIGVMPSHFEGFGLTAIEFIGNGTPVIAHAVDALPEIILEQINGALYHGNQPEILSKTILQNINLKNELKKPLIDTVKKFDIKFYKENLLNLYGENS